MAAMQTSRLGLAVIARHIPEQQAGRYFTNGILHQTLLRRPLRPLLQHRLQNTSAPPPQQQHPPPPQEPPPRSLLRRILRNVLFGTFFLLTGMWAGLVLFPEKETARSLTERTTDEQTNELYTPPDATTAAINSHILQHALARALRQDPAFIESRPHMKIPESMRARNLTGGTLAGPGRIVVPPVQFVEHGGQSLVTILYLGEQLCGHPGLVHGGMLATLLDEGLARCCFPALPNGIAVTANLKIDYRKPVKAEGYYVLRARTQKVEGRKAWVKGWIERLGDENEEVGAVGAKGEAAGEEKAKSEVNPAEKLVEAEALYIEPKNASALKWFYNV